MQVSACAGSVRSYGEGKENVWGLLFAATDLTLWVLHVLLLLTQTLVIGVLLNTVVLQ